MILCGIVGWKNSGKTLLAQKLIDYFSKKNYLVASIKHAHHTFDIDKPNSDSFLHRQAGAKQVIVSSSKRWAKMVEVEKDKEQSLNNLLKELDSPDIVIIEGFKNLNHPKVEVLRGRNNYLFPKLKNIIGIVSNKKIDSSFPQYKISEIENIASLFLKQNKHE